MITTNYFRVGYFRGQEVFFDDGDAEPVERAFKRATQLVGDDAQVRQPIFVFRPFALEGPWHGGPIIGKPVVAPPRKGAFADQIDEYTRYCKDLREAWGGA